MNRLTALGLLCFVIAVLFVFTEPLLTAFIGAALFGLTSIILVVLGEEG